MRPEDRGRRANCALFLAKSEERRLLTCWRLGDEAAGRRIVEAYQPLVRSIAHAYRQWGVPRDDLQQEGNIGLLKALRRFDLERDNTLGTYASFWIRAEIREFVVRAYRVTRIGANKRERKAIRIFRKTRESDPAKLAELSGMTLKGVIRLLPLLTARARSLDGPSTGAATYGERFASMTCTPEEELVRDDREALGRRLRDAVAALPDRERRIIEERWFRDKARTLEAIGGDFGISKERVRQLEAQAKRRLALAVADYAAAA